MKTTDVHIYCNNLESFSKELQGQELNYIDLILDLDPTFDIDAIPFNFKYAYSAKLITEREEYNLLTSQTFKAIDTLWVEKLKKSVSNNKSKFTLKINEKIINIELGKGLDDYYYKLVLTTEKYKLAFIAADFYDNEFGTVDYKINDEMIIFLPSNEDIEKFEKIITAHNKT